MRIEYITLTIILNPFLSISNYLGLKVGDSKFWYCESHTAGRTLLSISSLVAVVVEGLEDLETLGLEVSTSWIDWSFGRALSLPLAASTDAGLNCSWYEDADASSLDTCSKGVLISLCGVFFSTLVRSLVWKLIMCSEWMIIGFVLVSLYSVLKSIRLTIDISYPSDLLRFLWCRLPCAWIYFPYFDRRSLLFFKTVSPVTSDNLLTSCR